MSIIPTYTANLNCHELTVAALTLPITLFFVGGGGEETWFLEEGKIPEYFFF